MALSERALHCPLKVIVKPGEVNALRRDIRARCVRQKRDNVVNEDDAKAERILLKGKAGTP